MVYLDIIWTISGEYNVMLPNLEERREAVYRAHSAGAKTVKITVTGFCIPGKWYNVKRIDDKTVMLKEV